MTIIDKDHGWNALERRIDKLGANPYALVGIQGPEAAKPHPEADLTNVQLGTIHEFGLGVPRRSFIRLTFDQRKKDLRDLMAIYGQRIMLGQLDEAYVLELVGEYFVGAIKEAIRAHIHPELAPATIEEKNRRAIQRYGPGATAPNGVSVDVSTPLIRSGTLIASITTRVVRAGPSSGEGV